MGAALSDSGFIELMEIPTHREAIQRNLFVRTPTTDLRAALNSHAFAALSFACWMALLFVALHHRDS
ncbi:hypothetical protein BD410DRAFT_846401 [Rickenella mellea]|uniref:Uncharacterized protein n=1 Tax=Rickenella mellea TaxID=50990 RepID=A0A4Y7PF39_9AGAM|nr:hypothetical protein BD410DRAFT_846401 [Rickenella mellea]